MPLRTNDQIFADTFGATMAKDGKREDAKKIIESYDGGSMSRSAAFTKLKALGFSTDEIRSMLGDTEG